MKRSLLMGGVLYLLCLAINVVFYSDWHTFWVLVYLTTIMIGGPVVMDWLYHRDAVEGTFKTVHGRISMGPENKGIKWVITLLVLAYVALLVARLSILGLLGISEQWIFLEVCFFISFCCLMSLPFVVKRTWLVRQ